MKSVMMAKSLIELARSEKRMSQETHFCRECLRKDPPIKTVLVADINILHGRYNRGDWICDDCLRDKNRQYRTNEKSKYAEYMAQLHEETCEELRAQWEDRAYKRLKPSERVYKIWDKYNRRKPDKGIRKQWILEVIMEEDWFIDAAGIVQDFFAENGYSKTKQLIAKPYLIDFVQSRLSFLQAPYRYRCENRWDAIVDAINRDHLQEDKLVASPAWEDPTIKEMVDNWYLLSREEERKRRELDRENKRLRSIDIDKQEKFITEYQAAKVEKEKVTQLDNNNTKGESE